MTAGRINPWVLLGLPMLCCAACQILFAAPVRIFGLAAPEPIFAMVPAVAWTAAGPSLAAPFAVLALGAFLDLLLGAPLGLWPVSLIAAHAFAFFGRPLVAGQGTAAHLAWWGGACAVAFVVADVFTLLAAGTAPNLMSVIWQFAATAALFPVVLALGRRYEAEEVGFR